MVPKASSENVGNYAYPNDLDLYICKKILLEKWRDDSTIPLIELSFCNDSVENICRVLWFLLSSSIIDIGGNTFPSDLLIEGTENFEGELIMNWSLIKDMDDNPHKVNIYDGFEIEILKEKQLMKKVVDEIKEYVSNNAVKIAKKYRGCFADPDCNFYKTPAYLRGVGVNIYSYKKQQEVLLKHVIDLYQEFENKRLVIKFDDIKIQGINVLRAILAAESVGFFTITELSNSKKKWTDKDRIYAKILLSMTQVKKIKNSIGFKDDSQEVIDKSKLEFTEDENIKYEGKVFYGLTALEKSLCRKVFSKEANFCFKTMDVEESVYEEEVSRYRQEKLKKLVERLNKTIKTEFGIVKLIQYSTCVVRRLL
jgi:hypothetical protein